MTGAGTLAILYWYQIHWVVMLGEETGGQYAGCFNISCGKEEPEDKKKSIWTAARELWEEFSGVIQRGFRLPSNSQHIMMKKTPIYIVQLPKGTSRKQFRPNKEMRKVSWFPLANFNSGYFSKSHAYVKDIDGKSRKVCYFALQTISKAKAMGLIP